MTDTQLPLFDVTASVTANLPPVGSESDSSSPCKSVIPPAAPWTALEVDTPASGYLSEDLSRLPIRAITSPDDNKSDPNIETGTYGLFSTCERGMRAGIVNNKAQVIVFLCRGGNERAVAGYYHTWLGQPKGFGIQRSLTTPLRPTLSILATHLFQSLIYLNRLSQQQGAGSDCLNG